MRRLLALLLFLPMPVHAADWGHYVNDRFGAAIDFPPGFVNDVPPPENGDGLTFHDPARRAELMVWGGNLAAWDFKEDADQVMASEAGDGFTLTYVSAHNLDFSEPGRSFYAYSGTKAGRVIYAKALASCKGTQAVHFRIEYPVSMREEFKPIVSRLAASLKAEPAKDCAS